MEAVASGNRVNLRVALVTAAAVVAAGAVLVAYESTRRTAASVHTPPIVTPAGLVQRSGVRVVRVAVTGDGGLVDLRYQIVDADRAASVHDPNNLPLLIDERTGALIDQPLMGHIHHNAPKAGVTYYIIFNNPGTILHSGGYVTVRLGDARLRHVRVL